MAYYSADELKEVLQKIVNEGCDYKYVKSEKLGVVYKAVKENNLNDLYVCNSCKKSLLSSHLLSLHVAEHHDTFFELQKDRKPSFACYLEDCKVLSASHEERKDHAIKIHKFPHDFYDFKQTSDKSQEPPKDEDITMENTNSSSESAHTSKHKSNYFQFGHKANKTFTSKSTKSKQIDMKDLMDVLPD